MKHFACTSAAVCLLLAGPLVPSLPAQNSSGAVVMRSEDVVTWWAVEEGTGRAAFFGGDVMEICTSGSAGYDLLDFQEVKAPNELATNLLARGDDVGASLWERAPRFAPGAMCQDILAMGLPIATGEARLTVVGRFPTSAGDASATSPYGVTARGTLRTPEGEEIDVDARLRCQSRENRQRCTQEVRVR